MIIAEIDPNLRVRHGATIIVDDDIVFNSHPQGLVQVDDYVLVFERESTLYGPGIVTALEDPDGRGTIYYIRVAWPKLHLVESEV